MHKTSKIKIIIVTGTPGTGKTTLAKQISKVLGYKYIDVNRIIAKHKISEGYDKKRKSKIIDTKKLVKALIELIKGSDNDLVIDSHLSHYIPSKYVDLCIVTKCDLKKVRFRLKKRGYSEEKIVENLDSEIFDICLNEAKGKKHKVLLVDTSRKIPSRVLKLILD